MALDSPLTTVSVPGLLTYLEETQRQVAQTLAGLDADGPRTLEEASAVLEMPASIVSLQAILALRSLLRGQLQVIPGSLRLLGSFPAENASLWWDNALSVNRVVLTAFASEFPSQLNLWLVNIWTGGLAGREYHAGVRVVATEGQELDRGETVVPGGMALHNQVLQFAPLTLPAPGTYTVQVWLEGAPLHAYPLYIREQNTLSRGAS